MHVTAYKKHANEFCVRNPPHITPCWCLANVIMTVPKAALMFCPAGKMPTVVSPELYRARFCEAMDKYFLMVPDHWTGLGVNC